MMMMTMMMMMTDAERKFFRPMSSKFRVNTAHASKRLCVKRSGWLRF
jgi:hypothetical protein